MIKVIPCKTNRVWTADVVFEYRYRKKAIRKTVNTCLTSPDSHNLTSFQRSCLMRGLPKTAEFSRVVEIRNAVEWCGKKNFV